MWLGAGFGCIFSSVDVDAVEVRLQNRSLEPLLRLTAWEQQFAKRMALETAFSSGALPSVGAPESHGQVSGGSSSISRHATDLLQQTISSLASHAAAHGLPFVKAKDESKRGNILYNCALKQNTNAP